MGAILGPLLLVGGLIHYWAWIAARIGAHLAARYGRALYLATQMSTAVEARRQAGLCARADRQHRWVLTWDDRGTYGQYTLAV
jgi:hypothetical protein